MYTPALWTFFVLCVPFLLAIQLTAVFVVGHKSRLWRLALLPFTLWTALRLVIRVKLRSLGDVGSVLNQGIFLVVVFALVMRAVGWTFDGEKYQRVDKRAQGEPANQESLAHVVKESIALVVNPRGVGWKWGRNSYTASPQETRSAFIWERIRAIVVHSTVLPISFALADFLLPSRSIESIYDMSLPFFQRHLLASTISLSLSIMLYTVIDATHSIVALAAVAAFRDDPASWPPMFNAPSLSTSLAEFWGKRWHQFLRHILVSAGGRPLQSLFGRPGYIIGAFFLSGVLHSLGSWHLGRVEDVLTTVACFLAMGVGILLEDLWKARVGRQVGGIFGRIWTFTWLICWSNIAFDVWGRTLVMGSREPV